MQRLTSINRAFCFLKPSTGFSGVHELVRTLRAVGTWLSGRCSAGQRGRELLLANLSPRQREDLARKGHFDVVGGNTGRRYRIVHKPYMNIHELDEENRCVCLWCFYPTGSLVTGDIVIAQKLALELYEDEALKSANRIAFSCEGAKVWCR